MTPHSSVKSPVTAFEVLQWLPGDATFVPGFDSYQPWIGAVITPCDRSGGQVHPRRTGFRHAHTHRTDRNPADPATGHDHGRGIAPFAGAWEVTIVDTDQSFRGLDAVDRDTAWVTGGSLSVGVGAVYRTTDGGEAWQDVRPTGSDGNRSRDTTTRGLTIAGFDRHIDVDRQPMSCHEDERTSRRRPPAT